MSPRSSVRASRKRSLPVQDKADFLPDRKSELHKYPAGTSPFFNVRDPARWTQLESEFLYGAHHLHVAERMLSVVLFFVNDACRDLDIRYVPKLALNGRAMSVTRSLTATSRNVVMKRLTVKLEPTGVLIGEEYICLDSEGAVTRLAHALLDIIEKTWNSNGR